MTNILHQWLLKNKKLLTQGKHFVLCPAHRCVLERECTRHRTNGSGFTLNIQMAKLIVHAWIPCADYLAPLAALESMLKATQHAFVFIYCY